MPPKRPRRPGWRWYRQHARCSLHRDLLHQRRATPSARVAAAASKARCRIGRPTDAQARSAIVWRRITHGRHRMALQQVCRACAQGRQWCRPPSRPKSSRRPRPPALDAAGRLRPVEPATPERRAGPPACAASCRWPGRCSSGNSRCWRSATIDTVLVARARRQADLAALAVGCGRLHHRSSSASWVWCWHVSPMVGQLLRRAAATARPLVTRPTRRVWLALGPVGARQHAADLSSTPSCALAQGRRRRWPKSVRGYLLALALLTAGLAAVHCLPWLQHRRVTAEGGDGTAGRRPGC